MATSTRNAEDFDADWYIREYPDVSELGIDPLDHYLRIGQKLGRSPTAGFATANRDQQSVLDLTARGSCSSFESFGVIRHNPLISILIVSFNSSDDLRILFPTIASQTYSNFEIILVENGHEDNLGLLEQHFDRSKYLTAENVGFAEGNNVALRASSGELIAVINPDTRLAEDAIQNLVDALRYDGSAAAAVPKIMFFERFVRLEIVADAPFSVRKDDLLRGLAYKKLFVRAGAAKGEIILSSSEGQLALDLPYEGERTIDLKLTSAPDIRCCEARVGYSATQYFTNEDGNIDARISLNSENCSSARYMVNNAGSSLHPDGSPYDRGFAEFDDGAFFSKSYVDAFCGCAALIRRAAVLERDLFASPFFAYFEDSELSEWFAQQRYRILYQPEAKVFHRHSESTEEKSLLWNVLVGRSKRLYDVLTGKDPMPLKLWHYDYPDEFVEGVRKNLERFDRVVHGAADRQDLVKIKRPTACVYNSYFSSMGGGEKHALDIANILSRDYDVYLLSETDFDIPRLASYFSVELTGIRKIVTTTVDTWLTSNFDVFVNSTFRSNLAPQASANLYVVSFPHADIDPTIIQKYRFLHNSDFTASWARKFWGQHNSDTVFPILGRYPALQLNIHKDTKKNDIISVGRFTYEGHCKNHHLVLSTYKRMVDSHPELAGWRLRICGSCDPAQESAMRYVRDLRRDSEGYNVEILTNVDREILDGAYTDAAIYVHAAGLCVPEDRPELHEHFGITTFEAMAHGCLPVVYQHGGPAAQIEKLAHSRIFTDMADFEQALLGAVVDWASDRISPHNIQEYARSMHARNDRFAQDLLVPHEYI